MPARVKNFYVIAEVAGRQTPVKFGPVLRYGGFTMVVRMRDQGDISEDALTVRGKYVNGELILSAEFGDGLTIERKTRR